MLNFLSDLVVCLRLETRLDLEFGILFKVGLGHNSILSLKF